MPNLMERSGEWWTRKVMSTTQGAGREVVYIDKGGKRRRTLIAATSIVKKREVDTRRGRILRVSRTIRLKRADVPEPQINVDRVTIGNRTFTVIDWNPVGVSYCKLALETESVIASERENYRDFNG